MFSITATYFLYNSILFVCPLLCHLADKRNKRFLRFLAYFILIFVASIRFDIGADYENYYFSIEKIADLISYSDVSLEDCIRTEPALYLFTYLFSWISEPSIYVIGLYAIISLFLYYKIFDYYDIHTLGIITLILSFVYFQTWDWMRQGLALAICIYSTKYINENSLWKFLLCILCATLTHYSALLMLIWYPLRNVNLHTKIYGISIILIMVLGIMGLFKGLSSFFYDIIPHYSDIYYGSDHMQGGGNTYTSPTYILVMLCYSMILFICPQKYSFEATLLFIGVAIYGVSGGNLNMDRMAWYFTTIQVILLPQIYKYYIGTSRQFILSTILIVYFIIFNFVYIYGGFRGCTPYETIYSTEYQELYFRERDY